MGESVNTTTSMQVLIWILPLTAAVFGFQPQYQPYQKGPATRRIQWEETPDIQENMFEQPAKRFLGISDFVSNNAPTQSSIQNLVLRMRKEMGSGTQVHQRQESGTTQKRKRYLGLDITDRLQRQASNSNLKNRLLESGKK